MNKINKAFNKIKASRELKIKTYFKIKEHANNQSYLIRSPFISLSLTLACILTIFLIYNYNGISSKDSKKDLPKALFSTEKASTMDLAVDRLFYRGNIYIFDNSNMDNIKLDKKIGTLNQVKTYESGQLTNDFDSSNYDGASLYTIKGISNYAKLLVVDKNKRYVFKKYFE